jgi:hypothetical protein
MVATVRMWCQRCRRSSPSEALRAEEVERCSVCGGPLRLERRDDGERRGSVQRRWDPEERLTADRRGGGLPPVQ